MVLLNHEESLVGSDVCHMLQNSILLSTSETNSEIKILLAQLDLSSLRGAYAVRGSKPYDPYMLLALLV
jgi:hypothetical protein